MVVNAVISPQEGLKVQVSHAIPPNEPYSAVEKYWVGDAKIQIFESDTVLGDLKYRGQGLYTPTFDLKATPGSSYHLEISHAKYGEAKSSEVIIPNALSNTTIKVQKLDKKSVNGRPLYSINLAMEDPLEPNFYLLNSSLISPQTTAKSSFDFILRDRKAYELCEFVDQSIREVFFQDICFKGQSISLPFEAELPTIYEEQKDNSSKKIEPTMMEIRVCSITEAHYLYRKTGNVPDDFSLAFSDPEPLYSNMQGGYGLFKAINYKKYSFSIR
jgi:Domain of unknown function (DUF4249)